jgi:hypothetical protein
MKTTFTHVLVGALLLSGIAAAETPKNPVAIDFSYAGYGGGGQAIPSVAAVIAVKPTGHDDTWLLQSAIDHVGALPLKQNGFRGAVLLAPGRFLVKGHLQMRVSGVVLRGSAGTTIVATGVDRRTLIEVGGSGDSTIGTPVAITDDTVPAGANSFKVANVAAFAVGDSVVVRRPSTDAWIKDIGMIGAKGSYASFRLDWLHGSHDVVWSRTVTAVDAASGTITIDAPITTALEAKYGGGTIAKVTTDVTLNHLGVENLTLDSAYNTTINPKDEDHSWIAIEIDHAQDSWVRSVTARHFVDSTVFVGLNARRITIADSRFEAPVSEEGGYRRQAFVIYGQQVLVQHCHSELGMNDFAVGLVAAGPNVFLDDTATDSIEPSGPFEGWASGVLYENVNVSAGVQLILDVPPPLARAQGAGWTAANSVLWNVTGKKVKAKGPDGAPNFVVNSDQPLYKTELAARGLQPVSSPVPHDKAMTAFFTAPAQKPEPKPVEHPYSIVNGRFIIDGKVAWGESAGESWWKGDTSPATAEATTGSSVSKFKPGITAPGETEDLTQFAARVKGRGSLFIEIKPGLWYDHRRDAHFIAPEPSPDVWAPFFELPWARSGKGTGMDGLSLFDVSRYNPWYFQREREFAKLAAENGFIVYFDVYNDHNVLEIGPHWADFPWRPRNSVNKTSIPEPPPYPAGALQKPGTAPMLNVGNQFFNVNDAPLRKLHHDYLMHVFDELGDQPNVIFNAAYQFAGPIAFEQFFQDTAAEWEKLHHHKLRIELATGKNTTDAILSDPVRRKQIAVVDMRYWVYEPDGKLFAPDAGQNLAFRKIIQATFPGYADTPPPSTPELVYKQVREYRDRYPNIALVPMESGTGPMPILMAGAASQSTLRGFRPRGDGDAPPSDAVIDKFVNEELSDSLMKMGPVDGWITEDHNWVLAGDAKAPVLIDARAGTSFTFAKNLPLASYRGMWFDAHTGEVKGDPVTIAGTAGTSITKPGDGEWLLLLKPAN